MTKKIDALLFRRIKLYYFALWRVYYDLTNIFLLVYNYGSSSSSVNAPGLRPVIRLGERSLINSSVSKGEASSFSASPSIHLEDIPKDSPLYGQLQAYLKTQKEKQSNTFATVASLDHLDDIKNYEKLDKKKIIFCIENSEIQRQNDPWKILQRYLIANLYFSGKLYKTRSFYENLLVSTGSVEFNHF